MKQPELGQRIASIRKEQNLTQEELVERCNVSVRTIQRIEAGEVTPRISTIKIILAALGQDIEDVTRDNEERPDLIRKSLLIGTDIGSTLDVRSMLQTAWIAGVVYFVLGLIDGGLDYLNFQHELDSSQRIFLAVTKITVLIAYLLFVRGFIMLGHVFDNYLLKVSGYLIAAAFLVITSIDVFHLLNPMEDYQYLVIQGGASVTVGAIGLVLGIGFWRLQDGMGRLAAIAGVFELLAGLFFLTVFLFFLAYIMLIPATIVEIVLLFKAYEFISKEKTVEK